MNFKLTLNLPSLGSATKITITRKGLRRFRDVMCFYVFLKFSIMLILGYVMLSKG